MAKEASKYLVIRDTQEKVGYWDFPCQGRCLGTKSYKLKTGDYTIEGLETQFTIERKRSTSEYANNLFSERFHKELVRMDSMEHPYLFLEFSFEDIIKYPLNSGIPKYLWKSLKITPYSFLKAHHEMRIAHPNLRVEFVGRCGTEAASSLFKRIADYAKI